MKKLQQTGFTLIEVMVAMTIVLVFTSVAIPSFNQLVEENRLKEAVELLKADLMLARSETIKQNVNLQVSLVKTGALWCYGINNDNTSCACGTAGDCDLKAVDGSVYQGVTLDASANTTFDFRRGTAAAMGATLSSANYAARVVVSASGRIRVCSPDSTKAIGGYDGC